MNRFDKIAHSFHSDKLTKYEYVYISFKQVDFYAVGYIIINRVQVMSI